MIKNRLFLISFLKGKRKKIEEFYEKSTDVNFFLAFPTIFWMLFFFVAPFLIILKISFSDGVFGIPPYTNMISWGKEHFFQIGLNLQNYYTLIKDSYYRTAFANSITISFVSTFFCTVLGYIMAYAIHSLPQKVRSIFLSLISLSFWTAFLIRVYAWMSLLAPHGIVNRTLMKLHIIDVPIQFLGNYYSICVGIVFCYLPFVIFPVYSSLGNVDDSYIEAASNLGARPIKIFWKVTIPLTKNGIIGGAILVFATTVCEFIIPEILGGPDVITIGRVLWIEFFNNLDWPIACALSVMLVFFIMIPVFFLQKRTIVPRGK
ncbi:MAG: ABC transporter permease subunit [Holosporales bacterium]|jgi:putrescine transport system permease protein|nr:ABC transporter permease subunit [Holosporales bacterium]